jgi:TolB protein
MAEDPNQKSGIKALELFLVLITIILAVVVIGLIVSPSWLAPLLPVSLDKLETPRLLYIDGDQTLYITDRYGQRVKRIYTMRDASNIYHPTWSPNGEYIVFSARVDGNKDLYRINSDGSNLLRMTTNYTDDIFPDISPDGSQVVFTSNREEGGWQLYLISIDGSGLIKIQSEGKRMWFPDWWPSGDRILFQGLQNDTYALYLIAVDESSEWVFSSSVNSDSEKVFTYPAVSPDGQHIAYLMENELHLTTNGSQDMVVAEFVSDVKPAWSPDSNFLAFATPTGISILNIISMETKHQGALPTKSGSVQGLSWGPLE